MLEVLTPGEVKLPDGRSVEFANLDLAAAPCLVTAADAVPIRSPDTAASTAARARCRSAAPSRTSRLRKTVAGVPGTGPADALNLLARVVPSGVRVLTFDTEHPAACCTGATSGG